MASVCQGQGLGAIMESKLQLVYHLVGNKFRKAEHQREKLYDIGTMPKDVIPWVRIYLFADTLVPFMSDCLSAENMAGRWTDVYAGGWYGNFFLDSCAHLEQDKDSLVGCLGMKFPSRSCLIDYLRPDLIVTPCWVYYGPADPVAIPEEFGWISNSGRGLGLIGCCDYWVGGKMYLWHREPPAPRVAEKYTERTVLCLEEPYSQWLLKDGIIYTGVHLDSAGNLVFEDIQDYLDKLNVYPSFARYFNQFDNSRCIPKDKRLQLIHCLELIQNPEDIPPKKAFKRNPYMGRYSIMRFPVMNFHYYKDIYDIDTINVR